MLSDGLGPPADLVPNRLCQEATVCFGCILTPSLSPSAAEYFHLVAPGPVLGRIPEKGHLKKRMFGLGAWLLRSIWSLINLLAASAASRSLAFDLDRCLRKYKINSPLGLRWFSTSAQKLMTSHTRPGLLQQALGGVEHAVSHRSITKSCGSGWVK